MADVNGLTGPRRLSRPVRVTLADKLAGPVDGAWWPHSRLIASELPDLVGALQKSLGEIVHIRVNWSPTEGSVDLQSTVTRPKLKGAGEPFRRPRLMVVTGRTATAKLLVVPSLSSQALGAIVMRAAAGLPTWSGSGDAELFHMAQAVVGAANAESAKWCPTIDQSMKSI